MAMSSNVPKDSRRQVLFVGNDASSRAWLEGQARAHEAIWDVRFATGSEQARDALRAAPVDVIVVDPRPDHGDSLLGHVRREHPLTARVTFGRRSGSGRSQAPMHDTVATVPADGDASVLLALVDRSCRLQALLNNPVLSGVVGTIDRLPSVPRAYWDLMQLADEDDAPIGAIARIVQSDPAMSAKVLQLANSAYFGLAQRVGSIAQAVSFLGIERIKSLVLTAGVYTAMDGREPAGLSLEHFQQLSLRVARLAQQFLGTSRWADEAFTAGVVHNIGQLVLGLVHRQAFEVVLERVAHNGEAQPAVEREVFGVSHAEVGAFLLASWGLPFSIVECAAYHHDVSAVACGPRDVLAAVHAADALLGIVACRDPEASLNADLIERAGFAAELPAWRRVVESEIDRASGG